MSHYSTLLAQARTIALTALLDALKSCTDPAETRRLATAILKAPAPDENIDKETAAPQPTSSAASSLATSPERSEGAGLSAPAAHSQPRQSAPHRAPPLAPSLRSRLVPNVSTNPARASRPLAPRNTLATQLLAHSGRAP